MIDIKVPTHKSVGTFLLKRGKNTNMYEQVRQITVKISVFTLTYTYKYI